MFQFAQVGEPDALADGIGGAPEVDVVVRNPTRKTIGFFRRLLAAMAHVLDEIEERRRAFTEIACLSRPVIHLNVDVGSPVSNSTAELPYSSKYPAG